jgi:hypothetical protein
VASLRQFRRGAPSLVAFLRERVRGRLGTDWAPAHGSNGH